MSGRSAVESKRLQVELQAQIHEVRASEQRLRDVLEGVNLVAVSTSLDGRITFCNRYMPRPPTLHTGQRRRAARPASARTRAPVPPKPLAAPTRCGECGVEIRAGRRRCESCHRQANEERLRKAAPS